MKEKLTLQELSAYLPYGVKFMPTHFNIEKKSDTLYYLTTIHNSDEFGVNGYTSKYIKPILYPLSHLTKEIEHKGERFVPIEFIKDKYYTQNWGDKLIRCIEDDRWIWHLDYSLILHLHEWHFDTFGLIERGLAIDKTTIL